MLTVVLDDLRADPSGEYRRVLDFLGLPDDGRSDFPVVNAASQTRSLALARFVRRTAMIRDALGLRGDWRVARAVRRLNTRSPDSTPSSPTLRNELRDYFRDDIQRLSELLDRDLSAWLAEAAPSGVAGTA